LTNALVDDISIASSVDRNATLTETPFQESTNTLLPNLAGQPFNAQSFLSSMQRQRNRPASRRSVREEPKSAI
jgi:hypothetical protein